ncbi:MAG: AAA family ATPase [Spirochaetaceae bacterium]|jgi:shikimate kinase|nr:AAA family ATPase [Spirochaetaceae bacterium]
MNIILITGPKHAGKTSAGRELAGLTGNRFADLDETVERRTGKSPRELYKEGPEQFRLAEARALAGLADEPDGSGPCIIAAGGGIIDNEAAVTLLKARRICTVYLEVSPETAWRRIRAAGPLPPFLDTPCPRETHADLHRRRSEAYKKLACITVVAEGKSPAETAQEIAEKIGLKKSPSRAILYQ